MVGGLTAAWVLSFIWWLLLEPAAASEKVPEFVIPEGTAAAVAAGQPAPFIPTTLSFSRSGELRVRNNDSVEHKVAEWTVPPGGTAVITTTGDNGELTCTVHPGGSLGFKVPQRPSFMATIIGALILGVPMGAAFGFAALVAAKLNMDDDEPRPVTGPA
jgi:hypothetical protein